MARRTSIRARISRVGISFGFRASTKPPLLDAPLNAIPTGQYARGVHRGVAGWLQSVPRRLAALGIVAVTLAGCMSSPHTPPPQTTKITTTTAVTTTTTTTTTIPPTTTTTTSVCDQNTPIDGCPLGTPAAIAWAQQQDAAAQAAANAQAEAAYGQCLDNDAQADAAAIAQAFGKQVPPGVPAWEPCTAPG